jgi:hypothetical protein
VDVDDDGDVWDALGDAEVVVGLAEVVPGSVVPWVCGWLGPQAVSISAAAATAVVITNPCEIR